MNKLTLLATCSLAAGLLSACGPYPPRDCRYDNTCANAPYDQNFEYYGTRYYRDTGGYYYATPEYTGTRYYRGTDGYLYVDEGYRTRYYPDSYYVREEVRPPRRHVPGGVYRPTQPENHPDRY